jgi:hypothetical protein
MDFPHGPDQLGSADIRNTMEEDQGRAAVRRQVRQGLARAGEVPEFVERPSRLSSMMMNCRSMAGG